MTGPALLGGRYEVRDVLGFGGMAEVRDGWDTHLSRAVAIKLLHPGLSSQPDIRDRFKVEARAAAALNHPNIVGVYDFGDQDGTPFIVMERLPGETLSDQIAFGPLPQAQVYTALRGVLAALAAAHDAGMLHRDIKPGNILLAPSGDVKVADFGIVKAPGSVHTTTGQLVGTLAYLSPGRIAGDPATASDDLYAAGVVGYESLTGRKPFTQEEIAPLARAITEDDPPPVAGLRPDVDPRLADVIERAMSRDPLRRFTSSEAMWDVLSEVRVQHTMVEPVQMSSHGRPRTRTMNAQRDSSSAALGVPPVTPSRRRPTRARKVAGAAALLGAIAAAAAIFALNPSSTTRPIPPEPVSISTPVSVPISMAPVPSPSVQPPPPPSPVIEQATQREVPANGNRKGGAGNNGNGKGNGNGNKKPK